MSAGDAFERCLRLAIVFGNAAAYRAGATCILRRHLMDVSAQSQRLPIKLGEENPPALIENGTVETAFLCNTTTWLLNSSFRRCRHVIRWSAPEGQRTPETIYEILDTPQTNEALSLLLAVGIEFHASNRHLSATE